MIYDAKEDACVLSSIELIECAGSYVETQRPSSEGRTCVDGYPGYAPNTPAHPCVPGPHASGTFISGTELPPPPACR